MRGEGTGETPETPLELSLSPEARVIPPARRAVRRWLLRRHLDEACALVEFVTSELLAEGVTHALAPELELRVEEVGVGVVRIEVRGRMSPHPQRFTTVAEHARRRRDALLSALCRSHDRTGGNGQAVLWAEVRADRGIL